MMAPEQPEEHKPQNFIHNLIDEHNANNRFGGRVVTRFPPEPNGYLHVGHAKAIWVSFSTAAKYGGQTHLRFDDTNPLKESEEFTASIQEDVKWLGFDWGDHLFHASDYFGRLYDCAVKLIKAGKAYVCDLNAEQVREYRGTLTEPGRPSPFRERPVELNLELFRKMRDGAFVDGFCTLRAKIDMSAGNINLRDPALYRIRRVHHMRTGDQWCIYPMYDFTHALSDAFEDITHSLCTLEFQDHRPLYDWFVDAVDVGAKPLQIEFSRLNVNYTVTSKRRLKRLVEEKHVEGWDDPRMPTIKGMRRRGYTPAAIIHMCELLGVTKKDSVTDMGFLEDCVRRDLNDKAPRAFGILNPLKIVIETYPEDKVETLQAPVYPQKPVSHSTRGLPFRREIYIEREDFMEDAPKKFFRLAPGREVRLRYGYVIKCERVVKNEAGEIVELRCRHDPDTLGKNPVGRKVKGIIHWLAVEDAVPVQVRLYDRLFQVANPTAIEKSGGDFIENLNPRSLTLLADAFVEPSLRQAHPEKCYQFERLGYFCADQSSRPKALVFNRTVTLRDTWAKHK